MKEIIQPDRICSRSEVLNRDCPVPKKGGVYAWYFKEIPPRVPVEQCISFKGLTLLYIGISPKAPPKNGKPPSRQNLRTRIRYHMQGNAEGSTLRLTLGCLLSEMLGIELRRVGSGKRMTFNDGEATLSEWLDKNAFVAWKTHDQPWLAEMQLIEEISLPLNLAGNKHHSFYSVLSKVRKQAKERAKMLEIAA